MIRINLAPIEARRRPGITLRLPSLNLGVLFGVLYLVGVGGVGYSWWGLTAVEAKLTADVTQAERELQSLKATLGQGANVKNQVAEIKRRVQVIEDITKGQARPLQLFDAFIDTVPANLWIVTLEEKDSVLKITGSAYSAASVSAFMANLRASGKFKDIDIVISRQDLAKTPSLVTFEVTCRFEA